MSIKNGEQAFSGAEPTLEDELEELTVQQQHAQTLAGKVTSAAEVEESRQLAISTPLPLHLDEARGEYGLGYN